jgi:acyl transferase domain-containing protein
MPFGKSASVAGRMLAANLGAEEAAQLVAEFPDRVAVAAFNSPAFVTVSGDPEPLEQIAHILASRGVFNRFLKVNYAFHSHHMGAAESGLLRAPGKVETSPAKLPMLGAIETYSQGGFGSGIEFCLQAECLAGHRLATAVMQPHAVQCQLAEQRAEQDRMVALLHSPLAAARAVGSLCRVIANLVLRH